MKRFLSLVAVGLITLGASTSYSQSRDLGARRLLLDDGVGGVLTIEYAGPGSGTFVFPSGSSTTVAFGTLAGQTLRWDGANWLESSALMNDGTNVMVPTGNFDVTLGNISAPTGTVSGNAASFGSITGTGLVAGPVRSDAGGMLINGATDLSTGDVTGTLPATSVGNGLTDAQVDDNLTINGGTISNTPISGSTGSFSTITGTGLVAGPVRSDAGGMLINGATDLSTGDVTGTLPAASVGNGLTDAQVDDNITVDGGTVTNSTITNSPISGNTGSFSTITGTGLVAGPVRSDAGGMLINGATDLSTGDVTGTLPATSVGNGLTDAQVDDNLTINGGSISNSPISGSTGSFTDLTATGTLSLPGNSVTAAMIDNVAGADVAGDIPGNAANVNGVVAVANGGTGLNAIGVGDLLVGSAANTMTALPTGATAGQVLTSNGAGVAPSWQAITPTATNINITANTTISTAQLLANDLITITKANNVFTTYEVTLDPGTYPGQTIIIRAIDNSIGSMDIDDGGNVDSAGDWDADDDATIMYVWDGTDWMEISRSAN